MRDYIALHGMLTHDCITDKPFQNVNDGLSSTKKRGFTMTATILTPADLTKMISQTRTRGGYSNIVTNFVEGGELYIDFMQVDEYKGKNVNSVNQSVTKNVEKLSAANPDWPELKCTHDDKQVIVVNLKALAAAQAAVTPVK